MFVFNDLSLNKESLRADLLKIFERLKKFPHAEETDLVIEDTSGGHANNNFIVHMSSNPEDRLFVRIFNKKMEYYLRHNERNYQFYNSHGLSVKIHCLFSNGCVMDVVMATNITWQTAERLYEPDVKRAVAEETARYHSEAVLRDARSVGFETGIGWHDPRWVSTLFEGTERYKTEKPELRSLPSGDDVLREMAYLDSLLDERQSPLAFIHGDLNPSNILYNEETKRATFVDYDSPSVTHAVFDIAAHFSLIHMMIPALFDARRPLPPDGFVRRWLHLYLTKKNELNGIHTLAPVSEAEVDKFVQDVRIAYLKVDLHMILCYAGLIGILGSPEQPMDPAWLCKVIREHWEYYLERKQTLQETGSW